MYMGGEQEIYTDDTPTTIVCFPKFWHAPVITKKVDKTYGFYLMRSLGCWTQAAA